MPRQQTSLSELQRRISRLFRLSGDKSSIAVEEVSRGEGGAREGRERPPAPLLHPAGRSIPAPECPPGQALEVALGGEVRHTEDGVCYHRILPVHRMVPDWDAWEEPVRRAAVAMMVAQGVDAPSQPFLDPVDEDSPLRRCLFLDLETTGFGNCALFLIGTMRWTEEGPRVDQYFARHYREEPAAIRACLADIEGRDFWFSFNGKSFDIPFLRNRCRFFDLPEPTVRFHVDLLHDARRRWRGHVPNHRLQTLETYLLGRTRPDDVPSALIPEAYHRYVETGVADTMARVLPHNVSDLVTMAQVIAVGRQDRGHDEPSTTR